MNPYLEIVRPRTCILAGALVWIGALISGSFLGSEVYAAIAAAMLISAGGIVINDLVDRKQDAILKRHRPIPSGRINERNVLYYATSLFLIGFLFATYVSPLSIMIALLDIILLILYSTHFRYYHVFGNFSISLILASAFLFGGAAAGNVFPAVFLAAFMLFGNTAKEILADIKNMHLDRAHGMTTIPVLYGISHSRIVASMFMFAAVAVLPFPFYYGLYGRLFLAVALASIALFFYSAYLNVKYKGIDKVGYETSWAIALGVLAFITGSLA